MNLTKAKFLAWCEAHPEVACYDRSGASESCPVSRAAQDLFGDPNILSAGGKLFFRLPDGSLGETDYLVWMDDVQRACDRNAYVGGSKTIGGQLPLIRQTIGAA